MEVRRSFCYCRVESGSDDFTLLAAAFLATHRIRGKVTARKALGKLRITKGCLWTNNH